MRRRLLALLAVALAVLGTAATAAPAAPSAGARIVRILRNTGLAGPGTGIAIVDVSTGELVYRRNAWRRLVPASNEKLFTSVTALSQLGPTFHFRTRIVGTGLRAGRTWRGNLYLVGSGDPTFSHADVVTLVRRIRALGIRHVTGRVIGDETIYDPIRYGPEWKRSYYGLESPPLSGLALNRDVNRHGRIVANPPRAAAHALRVALVSRGVAVDTELAGVGRAPTTATPLASVDSPPLWRIIRFMDRQSDNFTAEMLLKAIGAYAGAGGSTAQGIAVEREVLSGLLPDDAGLLSPVDGSGLSHANLATASAFARLLATAADDRKLGPSLNAALAVAGVDGTMEDRLQTDPDRFRVRGKTGTLDGVSTLSGYVLTRGGQRYAFSILMNGPRLNIRRAHEAQDRIVASLAASR